MGKEINPNRFELLCAAVVKMAVKDYKHSLKRLWRHPGDTAAQKIKNDCERFFTNEIVMYSDLDGKAIMRMVQKKVEEEMRANG